METIISINKYQKIFTKFGSGKINYKNINDVIFDKHKILDFLKQMVYCQLNLFYNCGVVHNNIHTGNIFIENNDDIVKIEHIDETFDYVYKKNTIYYNHIDKIHMVILIYFTNQQNCKI
jgi:RIO-like serine/threonine protein kinase